MDIKWHAKQLMAKMAIRLLGTTGWYSGYWNHWRGSLFDYADAVVFTSYLFTTTRQFRSEPSCPRACGGEPGGLPGVDLDLKEALSLVARFAIEYQSEYDEFPYDKPVGPRRFHLSNSGYSCGDAEILYSMIRNLKPKRIIEVGSGYTTLLISETIGRIIQDDPKYVCEFTAIEPYPPDYLDPLPAGAQPFISFSRADGVP